MNTIKQKYKYIYEKESTNTLRYLQFHYKTSKNFKKGTSDYFSFFMNLFGALQA